MTDTDRATPPIPAAPSDVAGVVERLRDEAHKVRSQKERGPAFHPPWGQDIIDANNAKADSLTEAAALIEALSHDREVMREATGARAVIRGDKIEISIEIDALPIIVSGSCATSDGLSGLWKVTDPTTFAKEVCSALNHEREDGTTRVHVMFDKAFQHAIEQGAEGIDEVTEGAFEIEAARLQNRAALASLKGGA